MAGDRGLPQEGAAKAPLAAAAAAVASPPRPCSAQSEASDNGSETDFTALPLHRRGRPTRAAATDAQASEGAAPLCEADLARSPFVDLRHPVTLYEGAKLLLMAPVVATKLLVLAVVLPYAWAVLALLLLGHRPQTPMHPLRALLVRQWVQQWGRFALALAGFYRIPTRGWNNLAAAEECRAILVFNHPSYVDAAAVATLFTPSGVSKAGVAQLPFIGLFGIALQLFFVERRGSGDRANRHVLRGDVLQAIAQRAADRRFPLVAIAPEATTKAQPCLLKFRRGAFAAGQPVCPVLLRYRYRHFNPGWGVGSTPLHFFRLLAQCVNHLEVVVLPPYTPSGAELRDWRLYAENVRRLMAAELGVPLVEQGLEEERQLHRAGARVNLRGTRAWLSKAGKGE